MKRRDFLKTVALGASSVAALPVLAASQAKTASADGQTNFHFLSISNAGTVGGVQHLIVMNGNGKVLPELEGGGSFLHFDNASPTPKMILGAGSWETKRLVSFNNIGSWGPYIAGILDMEINLRPNAGPFSGQIVPAGLKQVCNLAPANLFNPNPSPPPANLPEGYFLTIPGAPVPTFVPFDPPLGLTAFSSGAGGGVNFGLPAALIAGSLGGAAILIAFAGWQMSERHRRPGFHVSGGVPYCAAHNTPLVSDPSTGRLYDPAHQHFV